MVAGRGAQPWFCGSLLDHNPTATAQSTLHGVASAAGARKKTGQSIFVTSLLAPSMDDDSSLLRNLVTIEVGWKSTSLMRLLLGCFSDFCHFGDPSWYPIGLDLHLQHLVLNHIISEKLLTPISAWCSSGFQNNSENDHISCLIVAHFTVLHIP